MPAHSDDINVNNQAIKLVQAAIVQDKAKSAFLHRINASLFIKVHSLVSVMT